MKKTALLIVSALFGVLMVADTAYAQTTSPTPAPSLNASCVDVPLGAVSGDLVCTKIDGKLKWDAHKLSLTAVPNCVNPLKPTAVWTLANNNKNRTATVGPTAIQPGKSAVMLGSSMTSVVFVTLSSYGDTEKVSLQLKRTVTCPSPSPSKSVSPSPSVSTSVTKPPTTTQIVAPPVSSLPVTGSSIPVYGTLLGGALLLAGFGLMVFFRRRRIAFKA